MKGKRKRREGSHSLLIASRLAQYFPETTKARNEFMSLIKDHIIDPEEYDNIRILNLLVYVLDIHEGRTLSATPSKLIGMSPGGDRLFFFYDYDHLTEAFDLYIKCLRNHLF